jgi:hypothetical protein
MNGQCKAEVTGNKWQIFPWVVALVLALCLSGSASAGEFLKSWVPQRFLETDEALLRTAASPEGKMLAVQQKGGTIRIVDLEQRQTVKVLPRFADGVSCLALGPEGDVLVAGAGKAVYVVELAKGGAPRLLATLPSAVNRVAVFTPRQLVAASTADGLRVLNLASGDTAFSNTENPCLAMAFGSDGQTFAAAQGKNVTLYDLPNFIPRWKLPVNFFPGAIAFSQDASLVAVAGDSSTVVLAGVRDGQVRNKVSLGFSVSRVQTLALTPDAKGLVASSGARLYVVDDVGAADAARREIKLEDKVTSLVLSSRTQSLLASTEDTRFLSSFATSMQLPENMVMDFKPRQEIQVVRPVVEVLSPAPDAMVKGDTVQLLARVRTGKDQRLQSLKVLVDGLAVPALGGPLPRTEPLPEGVPPLKDDEELYRFMVSLPAQDCVVGLVGETRFANSRYAPFRLRRAAQPLLAAARPSNLVPPEVSIVSPLADAMVPGDAAQVILRVRSAMDQKFQAVQILVDGQPVEAVGGMRPKATPGSLGIPDLRDDEQLLLYSVPLPSRDCVVMAYAQSQFTTGKPAVVRLRRQAEVAKAPPRPVGTVVPPQVEILSPRTEEVARFDVVNLMVKVTASPEQPVTDLKVQVDGQSVAVLGDTPAPQAGPPGQGTEIRQLSVPIPPRDCTLLVWAKTTYTSSEIATLRVRREEKALAAPALLRPDAPVIVAPTVQLLSPGNDVVVKDDAVDLKVKVRYAPGQKVTALQVKIDGVTVPISALRGLRPKSDAPAASVPAVSAGAPGQGAMMEEIQEFRVPVPPKDCTIALLAETAMANSDMAILKVRYQERRHVDPQGLPRLYILAIGVAKYQDTTLNLNFPAKDAGDFTRSWDSQKNKLFREVVVKLITNENATRDNIMDGLEWLQKQVTQKDTAIAFFAGHGMNDPVTGQFYFLPFNANLDAVKRTMVANSDITSTLDALPGKRILFMDACHSASVSGRTQTRGLVDIGAMRKEMEAAGSGTLIFAAASGRQGAQENQEWGNGAFTKSLLEGLGGQADDRKTGRVTVSMLNAYITERVKELTGGSQTPIFKNQDDLSDFPLVVLGPVEP